MNRCRNCGVELNKDNTYPSQFGLSNICKECSAKASKEYQSLHMENANKREKLWRMRHPFHNWALETIASHRARGVRVEISGELLEQIAEQTKNCMFCGIELKWGYLNGKDGKLSPESPTLDQLNLGEAISITNMAIVCHRCNSSKRDRSMKVFVEYCGKIWDKFKDVI